MEAGVPEDFFNIDIDDEEDIRESAAKAARPKVYPFKDVKEEDWKAGLCNRLLLALIGRHCMTECV